MTLGDLDDKLMELREARKAIQDAETSISYGGNADTMQRKHTWLTHCKEYYAALSNEEVKL